MNPALQERAHVAAVLLEPRLGLDQRGAREVREAVRAMHVLAGAAALLAREDDGLAVLVRHRIEEVLGAAKGRITRLDVRHALRGVARSAAISPVL